jgi:hypothetical protein
MMQQTSLLQLQHAVQHVHVRGRFLGLPYQKLEESAVAYVHKYKSRAYDLLSEGLQLNAFVHGEAGEYAGLVVLVVEVILLVAQWILRPSPFQRFA